MQFILSSCQFVFSTSFFFISFSSSAVHRKSIFHEKCGPLSCCHRGGDAQEVNTAAVPPSFEDPSSTINFTADELSAVNKLMREKITLPEQLNQMSPEL